MEIVKQGQAKTALITPDNPVPVVLRAAEELQYHVRKATGAELPIFPESRTPSACKGLIYLGDCQATRKAGIETAKLAPAGFVIRLIGQDLFLAGNDSNGPIGNRWTATWHGTLFAVYEFLETEMGVRWLWPGELGEVIPARTDLILTACEHAGEPRFMDAGLEYGAVKYSGGAWPNVESWQEFGKNQTIWALRQRTNACTISLQYGHAFHGPTWQERQKTNPEYFQQLPDGTRGYLPSSGARDAHGKQPMPPHAISMCVSNPALHKQIIEDWKAKRPDRPIPGYFVNACENDTAAACTCDNCRAWDAPDPRFENHDYWSEGKVIPDDRWQPAKPDSKGRPAPSLSDRYAKFYLALQREAEKVDPQAMVVGYAYANYRDAPVQTTLNEHVVIAFVAWPYFPWTRDDIEEMRKNWDGWSATGARLFLRPNTMLSGHNFPFIMAHKLHREFSYCYERGLIGTSFDSLTGQWGTQGPTLYVLGRMHVRPDWPVEKILDEYYAGFGKAGPAVRRYFDYLEAVSDEFTAAGMDRYIEDEGRVGFTNWYVLAPKIFTPPVMAKAAALLKDARQAAQGSIVSEARVAFLEKGLTHAELTLAVTVANAAHQKEPGNPGLRAAYAKAMGQLTAFRNSILSDNVSNIGFLVVQEQKGGWDHTLGAEVRTEGNWGFEDSPPAQYKGVTPGGPQMAGLSPWELVLAPGQDAGVVAVVEGEAPEGKRYLQTVSFGPLLQRPVETVAGQTYRIKFQMRVIGEELKCLAVYWNDIRMDRPGTNEWKEYKLTVTATGKDMLKFQRVSGDGNPCLDAISVEPLKP